MENFSPKMSILLINVFAICFLKHIYFFFSAQSICLILALAPILQWMKTKMMMNINYLNLVLILLKVIFLLGDFTDFHHTR